MDRGRVIVCRDSLDLARVRLAAEGKDRTVSDAASDVVGR